MYESMGSEKTGARRDVFYRIAIFSNSTTQPGWLRPVVNFLFATITSDRCYV